MSESKLSDEQIDDALRQIPELFYDPYDDYPEYGNHALRLAYHAGYEAARCTCHVISDVNDECLEHGRSS